jgi:hypothetical protein
MWEWIVIGVLYAFGCAFFRLLGGLGAAEDALRSCGERSANRKLGRTASSSG